MELDRGKRKVYHLPFWADHRHTMFCDLIVGLHRIQPVSGSPPTLFGILCFEPTLGNISKYAVEAGAKQFDVQTWDVALFERKKS